MDASVRAVERELVRDVVGRPLATRSMASREAARRSLGDHCPRSGGVCTVTTSVSSGRPVGADPVARGENPFSPYRAGRQPVSCGCYVSVAVSARWELLLQPRGPICPRFVILTRSTISETPPDCGDSPRLSLFLPVAVSMLAARRRFAAIKLHFACHAPRVLQWREPMALEKPLFAERNPSCGVGSRAIVLAGRMAALANTSSASSELLREVARTAWRSG